MAWKLNYGLVKSANMTTFLMFYCRGKMAHKVQHLSEENVVDMSVNDPDLPKFVSILLRLFQSCY